MTKPIGYYVSDVDPNLTDFIAAWGDRLEALDDDQKFHLLYRIAEMLYESQLLDEQVPDLLDRQLENLTDSSLLSLAAATLEQLRHGGTTHD